MVLRFFAVGIFILSMVTMSWASGAHDSLQCTGCHGIHTAKGELIFAVDPNKKSISSSGNYFLDNAPPTGAVKYKDSSSVNYNNGNPWKEIGTWTMVLQ